MLPERFGELISKHPQYALPNRHADLIWGGGHGLRFEKGKILYPDIMAHMHIFCLIEVRVMVVAVQQPLADCMAILTMCIVKHRPTPGAVVIHKICSDQSWSSFQDTARIQDQRSMC